MKQILALLALLTLINLGLRAQLNKDYFEQLQTEQLASSDLVEWQQVGPGMAGYCEEFWCHPTDPKVMMMSPDMYNTYGTWDAGLSWHTIKDCDGIGKDLARVRKFEFSHQNASLGYCITGSGMLYKTEDTGRSWKEIQKFKGRYADIVVDPSDDKHWYIAPGPFWNVKATWRHQKGQSRTFPNNGIYHSADQGLTWNKLVLGDYETLDVGRIIVDPTNSKVIIAATSEGLLRSCDRGITWKVSAKGLPVNRPRDMDAFFDKTSKEFVIYLVEQTAFAAQGKTVTALGGVYRSIDHGKSWQNVSGNLAVDMNKITSSILRGKYWNSLAYWFQTDSKTIKEQYPELPTATFDIWHRIQVNPLNKNEIYLSHNNKHDKAFLPGGAWKSNDGGNTWIAVAREGQYWLEGKDSAYWLSRNNPTGVNTHFAHLQAEIDRREEMWGNRFLELSQDGSAYICLDQQILQSKNGGKTWEQMDDNETAPGSKCWVGRGGSNLPGKSLLLETGKKDRYLFCCGEHGLWQTAPLGNYPNKMAVAVEQLDGQNRHGGSHSPSAVVVHPHNPDIIFFLSYRQENRGTLRKSIDGGKTWENIATIFDADVPQHQRLVFQNSLLIDPVHPENMYFCATKQPISEVAGPYAKVLTKGDYGFYRSTDGGYHWHLCNAGFHKNASIRRLAMDPKDPKTLYAAANDKAGALYRSTNKGENWHKVRIPKQIESVNNIFIDRNTQHLFISCGNQDATDAGGGVWRSKDQGKHWEKIFDLPFIWQCETSPINPNIITVNAALAPKTKVANKSLNPGAYLSLDGGLSWHKVNRKLGQQDRIRDFKPDPYREDIFWIAQKGSGWAIGYMKGTTEGWSRK